MAILRYIISAFVALTLTGCFEDFTPKIDVTPVLCLNSLIEAGEPIEVSVTHTFLYPDENEDHSVADAVVRIYVNGEPVSGDYLPQEGDLVRIEAESSTYGFAEGEVKVPYAVPVKSITFKPTVKSYNFSDRGDLTGYVDFNFEIALEIEDVPDVDNYFKYSYTEILPEGDTNVIVDENGNPIITELANAWFYPGSFQGEREPIFGEHIGAFDAVMGGDSYGFTYFTDRQFAGRSYTLHLSYVDGSYSVQSMLWQDSLVDCGLEVTLSSISQSYYNWANYRWQAEEGMIGGLGEAGLAEQIWGYSNVSTGAGVVAAMSSVHHKISFSDFLTELAKRGRACGGGLR